MRKKFSGFGAITDDPTHIANVAIREANAAIRDRDTLGLRQAANKGWLAVTVVADVASVRVGERPPRGADGRQIVLEKLERVAKMRRGSLLGTFSSAKEVLHGECFHNDNCASPRAVLGLLDDVRDMTIRAKDALSKLPKRKKGC